jgi:glucose/arabinose dehydrogenase
VKTLLALVLLAPQSAETEPGLVAEYFSLDRKPEGFPVPPAGSRPTFVRVEPVIDHGLVTGEFHGTKLSENFFVRWTGILRCPREGLYNFYLESDDGSRLFIDHELVVDNAAGRAMEQKPDRVILKAGDHALRFEYFQIDGPAGVNLQWRMPEGGRGILPPTHLFHARGAEKLNWDRDAWEKRPAPPAMKPVVLEKLGRYATIDFGPFTTRTLGPPQAPVAIAGILLRVSPEATVCFETRDLRVAAAWTGPFLKFPTEKDGIAGLATIAGSVRFQTQRDAVQKGRWGGLYLHGRKVILSYTAGGARVLELHGFENGSFTRTIRTSAPLTVTLATGDVEAGSTGGTIRVRNGRVELEIAQAGTVKVSIPKAQVTPPEDLEAMTRGGPARWTEPVVTKGTLGREPGAYQLDTVTVPYENPWNSYMRLVALDFLPDGRAVVATLDGDVWIVSGLDAKLEKLSWRRFATGLCQPLGVRVIDGTIYALGRDQITRLVDLNGDGEADFYENFNNDYSLGPGYGEYPMDLQVDREGSLLFGKAASKGSIHAGCVLKVSKDGKTLEVVADGFRTPMGVCVGPDDQITVTDQQGNYMGSSPIVRVRKGAFYGFELDDRPETKGRTREPALCWLPMDMDNSPGGQAWVTTDRWGPLKGSLVHTSYGQSKLLLVLMDPTGEQAGVVRFPLNFLSGIMRAGFSPSDGQLYAAGLRGWQTTGVKDGCLQRVRYTGRPVRMPVWMRVRKTGIDLSFTDPVDPETAGDPDNYGAKWFNVVSTPEYGSPEFNVTDPRKRGREKVDITKATVLKDGKTVSLEIPALRPVTNLVLKFTIRAADGQRMSHEVSITINRLPE